MKQNFAILRVAKVHTKRQLQAAADHNNRSTEQGTEHARADGAAGLVAGDRDAVRAWSERMQGAGLDPDKPQRKGAVVALEWVASASPEFWATASQAQREEWAADTFAFIQGEAGSKGNVLAAWWHDDESTPHMHVLSIPLVEKERKPLGRVRKGRERAPATKGWGLAAKDIIGGSSDRLVRLQDDYAEAVAHHGLARGVPRRESGERNKAPAHWRAEQARLTEGMAEDWKAIQMAKLTTREAAQGALTDYHAVMSKAAAAMDYAQGLGEVVRADAKRLGTAISFPSYADNPNSAEAREAVQKAQERQQQERADRKAGYAQMDRAAMRADRSTQQGQQRVR